MGLTSHSAALKDPRSTELIGHTFSEMTRSRICCILADYEDQNDHDTLRSDGIFKLIAGRRPSDDDLASQPTLSRFENSLGVKSLLALRDVFVDQFIASFATPPRHLTLDIDPFDDPTHGQQQRTFFHGYYEQYQYLPRAITCADQRPGGDGLLAARLGPSGLGRRGRLGIPGAAAARGLACRAD